MLNDQIMNTVSLAQSDPYARNYLLIRNEGFVKKTAVNICNRLRQTNNNEILEIAFSAFNEAIDIFPKTKEGHFLSFARKVIELRMYEHFERTGKLSSLDMKNTAFKSITPLIEKPKVGDRREKILDLWEKHKNILEEHGFCYEDLLGTNEKQGKSWLSKAQNWIKDFFRN